MSRRRGEGAAATYQEGRLGIATSPARRLPPGLLVSDLGTWPVPMDARDRLPPGVIAYQVVDAHHGYAQAESALIAGGFGHARAWHYEALGQPRSFLDGEGRLVTRWLRLFTRTRGEGGRPDVTPWRGNPDDRLRRLERDAAGGDPLALARYNAELSRAGRTPKWIDDAPFAGGHYDSAMTVHLSSPTTGYAVVQNQVGMAPASYQVTPAVLSADGVTWRRGAVSTAHQHGRWALIGLGSFVSSWPAEDAERIARAMADGATALNVRVGMLSTHADPRGGGPVVVPRGLVVASYTAGIHVHPPTRAGRRTRVGHDRDALVIGPARDVARVLRAAGYDAQVGGGFARERLQNPDDELRRLERAALAGDAQARKRLAAVRARAGIRRFAGRQLPQDVAIERLADFRDRGLYRLTVAGRAWTVFRDPQDRRWYFDPETHPIRWLGDVGWIGDSLEEAVETLRRQPNPVRRNPDDQLRRAERGRGESPADEARWIAQLVRAGKAFPEQVAWVARLRDAASMLYVEAAGVDVGEHQFSSGLDWLHADAPGVPAMAAVVMGLGLLEDAPDDVVDGPAVRAGLIDLYRRWLRDDPAPEWAPPRRGAPTTRLLLREVYKWRLPGRTRPHSPPYVVPVIIALRVPHETVVTATTNEPWVQAAARLLLQASDSPGSEWRGGPQSLGLLAWRVGSTNGARRRLKEWVLAGGPSRWSPP